MKKILLSLGLIAMALNLTNCAKNDEVNTSAEVNGDFEICASITRTQNEGLNTVWSEGDMINLFHAVTDTEEFVNDTPYKDGASYPFKCVDAVKGSFMGTVEGELDPQEEYDWYALYPYSSYVVTPANNGNGYIPVGCKSNQVQYQGANNSMDHIAGDNYPMVGYAEAVPASDTPHLVFTHVSSLVEFEVVNKLAEPITVSSIQFTATEDIVGTYYINFADSENIVFTGSGDSYVSNSATLMVTGNEAIAAGASAKFYMAVKPFTAPVGGELAIKVSASTKDGSGVHEATISLAKATSFVGGKIKNVKVNYTTEIEAAPEVEGDWVSNAYNLVPATSALAVGDKVVIVAATKNKAMGAISGNGNNRQSATVVKNTENNTVDFDTKTEVFTVAAGTTAGSFAFKTEGSKYIYAAGGTSSNYLKEEDSITAKSSWSVTIANGVANIKAVDSAVTRNTIMYNGDSDLFSSYSADSEQLGVSIYKLVGQYTPAEPAIEIAASDASIAYNATSGAINLSLAYATGWKITATADQTWVKDFAYDSAKSAITFTSEANEGEERTANVTITATCDGYDDVVKSVVVKQAAKPSGDISQGASYTHTFASGNFSGNQTKTLSGLAWTLAGDGGYWGWDSNNVKGMQFGSGSKPYKSLTLKTSAYEGGVKTIKINSSGASSTNAKMTVSVGGTQVGSQVSLTSSAKDYTFTSDELLVGDIVISITQTSSKAIYIKSISIN